MVESRICSRFYTGVAVFDAISIDKGSGLVFRGAWAERAVFPLGGGRHWLSSGRLRLGDGAAFW